MINRLYTVSVTVTAVVMATSERLAEAQFKYSLGDIISDQFVAAECGGEIRNEADIPDEWSVDCLPYGLATNTMTIGKLLDVLPPEVVRDDSTADMFEVTAAEVL